VTQVRGIASRTAARGVMMALLMSVRIALASLALVACSVPGTDDGSDDQQPTYEDAAGIRVEPQGTLTLTQTINAAADQCPTFVPRETLVLVVADDGTVSSPDSVVVVEGTSYEAWEHAAVFVTLDDVWGELTPRIVYDISITAQDEVDGYASVDFCDAELRVVGSRAP
jgi:hypothetical protein